MPISVTATLLVLLPAVVGLAGRGDTSPKWWTQHADMEPAIGWSLVAVAVALAWRDAALDDSHDVGRAEGSANAYLHHPMPRLLDRRPREGVHQIVAAHPLPTREAVSEDKPLAQMVR